MKKSTGYKEMLRDRCPAVVDIALKWCNVKQKWIDHTYDHFIKLYKHKNDRNEATRIILGISKRYRNFDFHKTIDWDNLTKEETEYWTWVWKWVEWFMQNFMYIKNLYKVSVSCGKDEDECKFEILSKYLKFLLDEKRYTTADKLVDYLIKCINKK